MVKNEVPIARIILITIYIKSEQVDITPEEIRRMIDEYEHQ